MITGGGKASPIHAIPENNMPLLLISFTGSLFGSLTALALLWWLI